MATNPYVLAVVDLGAHSIRRIHRALALTRIVAFSGFFAVASDAWASDAQEGHGLAVVAEGSSTSSAWALAHAVYGDPTLRPPTVDEAQARALVGEPEAPDAPHVIRDLAETRAAIHGDDAPSRSLLTGLAATLHVKGLVLVEAPDGARPIAHVFVASTRSFDATVYESDPAAVVTWGTGAATVDWTGALTALHRGFAAPAPITPVIQTTPSAAALQRVPQPIEGEKGGQLGKPFYTSPWFWGALAAAAFAGAAFYFVSRSSSDPTIQLEVQVPR